MLRELSLKAKRRLSSPRLFPQDGNTAKHRDDSVDGELAPPPSPPPSRLTTPLASLRHGPSKPPTPRASFTSGKHADARAQRRERTQDSTKRDSFKLTPALPREPPKRAAGVTSPLLTTAELLAWRPTGAFARCVSRIPLPSATVSRYTRSSSSSTSMTSTSDHQASDSATGNTLPALSGSSSSVKRIQPPRLLLCHDFAHGYPIWEAHADGVAGDDCPEDSQLWRFNHWAYVDIFVYFSHYRVSIPPVGYIHAAHRHGTLVLGTLIFEDGNEGQSDLKAVLASFRVRAKAANQLATIAKFFGFDGWLVNVECALPSSQAAGDLAAFVADLTRATRKLVGAASEVIWYDAVTRTGELKWQNELNTENEQFFKAAGAIFTNYHWDRNAPVRSAVKAGSRRADVFTGIDVHGRNTYGGGGFHTHLALRVIKQSGTSAAVFAPAWTVERCPPNIPDPLELEERFWTGPRGKFGREAIAQYVKERPVINEIPFATNFDPGWGPCTIRNGLVVDERRYFNMSRQDVQPSFLRTYVASGDPSAASLRLKSGFALHGSASVHVRYSFSESRMMSGTYTLLRLFVANAALSTPGYGTTRTKSQSVSANSPNDLLSANSTLPTHTKDLQSAGSRALRCAYDYHVNNDDTGAANTFGLVLLFNSPPLAALLVGDASSWVSDASELISGTPRSSNPGATNLSRSFIHRHKMSGDDNLRNLSPGHREDKPDTELNNIGKSNSASFRNPVSARIPLRLQISGKHVNCHVLTPTREELVHGPPASDPGKWFSRVYVLPQELTRGQRLAEVMILVGTAVTHSQSVSPSPVFTPGGSRFGSRLGSRLPSRDVSRFASRSGSRASSRPGSRPLSRSGSRAGSRSNSPPRAEDILTGVEELAGQRALPPTPGMSRDGLQESRSRRISKLRLEQFKGLAGAILGDDDLSFGLEKFARSSSEAAGETVHARDRRQRTGEDIFDMPRRSSCRRDTDTSYAGAFAVAGHMDYSEMEGDDKVAWANSTSQAISRLSSRLGTPSRSRVGSRIHSRFGSRNGSTAASLAVSRTGSRSTSRFASPSMTPLTGGGGSMPLLNAALGSITLRSGSQTPHNPSTPGRTSQASLSDLKSALINAAGSMAGVPTSNSVANPSSDSRAISSVHLGSVRLEYFDTQVGRERRSSSGFDNDFFGTDASSFGVSLPVATSHISPRKSKRSFRL